MLNIKNFFSELVDISDEDWAIFSSKLIRRCFPKKSVILRIGERENFLSFIENGIIRYNIPKLDYDFTFGFAFSNSFVSGYDSFLTQQPSNYNLEAITDCTLWQISYDDLDYIYENTIIGDRIGRKIAESLYVKKMKREQSLLEDSAQKKYEDLLKEQPELILNIPLKYIASYIGIRPQSLSRIRRQIK